MMASHLGKLPGQMGGNSGSLLHRAGERPDTSALSTKIEKQEDPLLPHICQLSYSRMDFVYHILRPGLCGCQSGL